MPGLIGFTDIHGRCNNIVLVKMRVLLKHFDNYFYFKEEYNFGLTEQPKVDNQIFIDRNSLSVFEPHTRLGEINTMTQLEEYKNGYYKIKKEIIIHMEHV